MSPEGEEKVELDMKVYKDGIEYKSAKTLKQRSCKSLNKIGLKKSHTFDMQMSPIVDETDQSVNLTLKEMNAISNSLAHNSKSKKKARNISSKINESKYQYNIAVKDVKESDLITIKFMMPYRENIAQDNEYERPGRIAAYATLSL